MPHCIPQQIPQQEIYFNQELAIIDNLFIPCPIFLIIQSFPLSNVAINPSTVQIKSCELNCVLSPWITNEYFDHIENIPLKNAPTPNQQGSNYTSSAAMWPM